MYHSRAAGYPLLGISSHAVGKIMGCFWGIGEAIGVFLEKLVFPIIGIIVGTLIIVAVLSLLGSG